MDIETTNFQIDCIENFEPEYTLTPALIMVHDNENMIEKLANVQNFEIESTSTTEYRKVAEAKKIHEVKVQKDKTIQVLENIVIHDPKVYAMPASELVESTGKLTIPNEIWKTIFNQTTRKLVPKQYNHIVAELLSNMTGCQINIKSKDVLKSKIIIRTYCGHVVKLGKVPVRCRRMYNLVNNNIQKGVFTVFQSKHKPIHFFKKARVLSGVKRDELKKVLLHNSVSKVVENMLEENPDKVLPTQGVLLTARSEAIRGQDNDTNDFKDLCLELSVQKKNPETRFIQILSWEPYNVCTWSEIQFEILKKEIRKKSGKELIVYMDATGQLVSQTSNEDVKTILNYAIIIPIKCFENDPSDPFPLTEMISGSHCADTIGNFIILLFKYFNYI